MNFTSQTRYNPKTGRDERYYRLKESYRNALGRSCTRILLNVGFVDDLLPEEMRDISRALTYKYEHQDDAELWPDPAVDDGNVLARLSERNGVFKNASTLQLYYLGYGGNSNTTTRFRRYNGQPQPPLIQEYTDAAHLLRPNHWYRIRIEATPSRTRYYIDEELLIDYADPQPLLRGWFGFRTTWSHSIVRHFRVL